MRCSKRMTLRLTIHTAVLRKTIRQVTASLATWSCVPGNCWQSLMTNQRTAGGRASLWMTQNRRLANFLACWLMCYHLLQRVIGLMGRQNSLPMLRQVSSATPRMESVPCRVWWSPATGAPQKRAICRLK